MAAVIAKNSMVVEFGGTVMTVAREGASRTWTNVTFGDRPLGVDGGRRPLTIALRKTADGNGAEFTGSDFVPPLHLFDRDGSASKSGASFSSGLQAFLSLDELLSGQGGPEVVRGQAIILLNEARAAVGKERFEQERVSWTSYSLRKIATPADAKAELEGLARDGRSAGRKIAAFKELEARMEQMLRDVEDNKGREIREEELKPSSL